MAQGPTMQPTDAMDLFHDIWYFAYGSNMKTSVMTSRGLGALEHIPVRAPSYMLTFDIYGIPYSEPSMASICQYRRGGGDGNGGQDAAYTCPPDVHGVAYRLNAEGYARLIASEGGGVGYRELQILGVPVGSESTFIQMWTLVALHPKRPNAAPSLRYLRLIQEGAAEHALPQPYQEYLRTIPYYTASDSWISRLGARIFLSVARKQVRVLAYAVRSSVDVSGRSRKVWRTVAYVVFHAMWCAHDWAFKPIFGSGSGLEVDYGSSTLLVWRNGEWS
ncbi:gliotoxin biosynthesis protein GliK [Zymoseptoria brevis]|uniref:gamma-glutamylcyclotransferase n=1 Tax=Zymoseptoria brevis TaxID=1047168 RepID=A0A0F4GE75_9PEZI|nr:gliotoxin biosynthesis protein GliK [Zymoseptoria brevis]